VHEQGLAKESRGKKKRGAYPGRVIMVRGKRPGPLPIDVEEYYL